MASNRVNKGVRATARKAGVSPALVTRKLNRGATHAEIVKAAAKKVDRRKTRGESFVEAQARKEKALADLREVELAEKRGELIDLKEQALFLAEAMKTMQNGLLSAVEPLAERIDSSRLIEVRGILDAEFRKLLNDVARRIRDGSGK